MNLQNCLDLITQHAATSARLKAENPDIHWLTWVIDDLDPDVIEELATHLKVQWTRTTNRISVMSMGDVYFIHFHSVPVEIKQIFNRVK
jgi:hypothetical protein